MAEQLELDEIRAHALNNIGNARVTLGDAGGVADIERSVEISAAVGSVESVRGYLEPRHHPEPPRPPGAGVRGARRGRRLAERLGDATGIRWFAIERLFECYWTGCWDDAAADAEAPSFCGRRYCGLLHRARIPAGTGAGSVLGVATSPARSKMPSGTSRSAGRPATRRRSTRRSRWGHGRTVRPATSPQLGS